MATLHGRFMWKIDCEMCGSETLKEVIGHVYILYIYIHNMYFYILYIYIYNMDIHQHPQIQNFWGESGVAFLP